MQFFLGALRVSLNHINFNHINLALLEEGNLISAEIGFSLLLVITIYMHVNSAVFLKMHSYLLC